MNLPNLSNIASAIVRALKPRKGAGQAAPALPTYGPPGSYEEAFPEPPPGVIGLPKAPVQPPPPPQLVQGPARSPELDRYGAEYEAANARLNTTMPSPAQAEIDPMEAVLSVIAGMGSTNLAGKSKAFSLPLSLAQQRADRTTELERSRWEQEQKNAQFQMGSRERLIGADLDRDAISDRIAGQLKQAEMKGQIQQAIAAAKNDTVLIGSVAKLAGQGQITVPGVSAIYQGMGMDADSADQVAAGVVQQVANDPSMQMKLKAAHEQTLQDQLAQKKVADSRKLLRDPNATATDRLGAMMDLQELGDPLFGRMTFNDMKAASAELGSVDKRNEASADLMGAKTKTEDETRAGKVHKLLAEGKFVEARTEYEQALTANKKIVNEFLPEKARAEIDNLHARTKKAMTEADAAIYGTVGGGRVGGRSLTPTAYFNAINAVSKAIADVDGQIEYVRAQDAMLERQKAEFQNGARKAYDKSGNEIDAAQKVQEIEAAIENNATVSAFLKTKSARYHENKSRIEAQAGQPGQPGGHGSRIGPPSPTGGNRAKIDDLRQKFDQAFPGGRAEQLSGTPRNIGSTGTPSLHNTGEALDFYHGNLREVADWAISQPGVKTVIFNNSVWSPGKGWRPYTVKGGDPHTTHVHVDMGRGGPEASVSQGKSATKPAATKTKNRFGGFGWN